MATVETARLDELRATFTGTLLEPSDPGYEDARRVHAGHARIGWLGLAATVPEHRRKGAQGAILAARFRAAAAAGLREVATETGERLPNRPSSSYRNLLRFGFEERYVRPNYLASVGA